MQAKALALLLVQRGELTCTGASEDRVNIICSKPAYFEREGGASQLDAPGLTIGIRYVKVCIRGQGVRRTNVCQHRKRDSFPEEVKNIFMLEVFTFESTHRTQLRGLSTQRATQCF